MTRRKRKPQPAGVQPESLVVSFPNFRPPVPVQPGDQVVTRFTEDGPLIVQILREGREIWPAAGEPAAQEVPLKETP